VHSLALTAGADRITAIGNVGDDLEFVGLYVSPDLDTVLYTVAGLLDEERGWGVRDETYGALAQAERLGEDTWFTLGDRDIGLHLARTRRLRAGEPLSVVTAHLCSALGVAVRLLPATDDPVRTFVQVDDGELEFQSWYVGRRHEDPVRGVRFEGADAARPAPGVVEALETARAVVIAPSNPFVSIGPILAVPGIRGAIEACAGPVAAISPIIGGQAVRGPLAGMLETLGREVSALGVARVYTGLVDTFILDVADAALATEVGQLGLRPVVCETLMEDPARRPEIGLQVLEALLG
jgi:LPPG:FO 2-phospho-L-lactate transferase